MKGSFNRRGDDANALKTLPMAIAGEPKVSSISVAPKCEIQICYCGVFVFKPVRSS